MKLTTKIEIANQLAREHGARPKMTMNELWDALRPLTANSRAAMREKIARAIGF